MKKILVAALSLITVFGLAGCGGSAKKTERG